jgi:hypothetical protein
MQIFLNDCPFKDIDKLSKLYVKDFWNLKTVALFNTAYVINDLHPGLAFKCNRQTYTTAFFGGKFEVKENRETCLQ